MDLEAALAMFAGMISAAKAGVIVMMAVWLGGENSDFPYFKAFNQRLPMGHLLALEWRIRLEYC